MRNPWVGNPQMTTVASCNATQHESRRAETSHAGHTDDILSDPGLIALYYFNLTQIYENRIRERRNSRWWRLWARLTALFLRLTNGRRPYSADDYISSARFRAAAKTAGMDPATNAPPYPAELLAGHAAHVPATDSGYLFRAICHAQNSKSLYDFEKYIRTIKENNYKNTNAALALHEIFDKSKNGIYSSVVSDCAAFERKYEREKSITSSLWAEFYDIYSHALSRLGQHEEALGVLDRALRKLGNRTRLLRRLASIRTWSGDLAGALSTLDYMEQTRGTLAIRDQLLRIHLLQQIGDLAAAEAELEVALKDGDELPDVHLAASSLALRQEDHVRNKLALDRFFAAHSLRGIDTIRHDRPVTLDNIYNRRVAANEGHSPLVTVIMTAYQASMTVRYAVESVLAQSHSRIELIVVEDGGHDGTIEILEELARQDARIKVISNSENIGTYRSKNSALQHAKGDFLTFHDSDDWWHPDHIDEHLRLMRRRPELVASVSNWVRIDRNGVFQLARSGLFLHLNPASIFIRREAADKIGGFDAHRTGADSEYLQRIRSVFGPDRVGVISKPLALGLHRPDSLTQSGVDGYDENRYSASREYYRMRWLSWHREAAIAGTPLYLPLDTSRSKFAECRETFPLGSPREQGAGNQE